ncbi:MAG TPA: sugar phosphate isomerase/epimerase family protein [Chthoniobacteraceae bacterium]|nr:sugar phosphate isomerase/epimerase family protein [Chthoniobacteraceae bacterium]
MKEPHPIYLHINYFENRYPLEEAFAHTRKLGCTGIEVRDRDRSGAIALDDYLALTARLSREHGLDIVYGCRVETTDPDPAKREASIANFHKVLEHARRNGFQLLNVFTGILMAPGLRFSKAGSTLATEDDWRVSTEVLSEAAAKFPTLTLAVETHSGYLHDLAEECARLLCRVNRPNVRANLDFGNIHINRRGTSWRESLNALKGSIGYLHLKNVRTGPDREEGDFDRVPLSEGDLDIAAMLRDLQAAGFTGPIGLENTMKEDKLPIARADLRYLRECLGGLIPECGDLTHPAQSS